MTNSVVLTDKQKLNILIEWFGQSPQRAKILLGGENPENETDRQQSEDATEKTEPEPKTASKKNLLNRLESFFGRARHSRAVLEW